MYILINLCAAKIQLTFTENNGYARTDICGQCASIGNRCSVSRTEVQLTDMMCKI